MDGAEFRDAVAAEKRTELDRLASNELLVALTDGELTSERVLRAAADSENAAHHTFAAWADDEPDAGAAEAFAAAAEREQEHRERVLDELEGYDPADGGALHRHLRSREGAAKRLAAGFVGRGLVADQTHKQIISFFVKEAGSGRAELFRELRRETEASLERGLALLAERCESPEEWDDARAVAGYTIQVAYDDYADALRGMGADPKPVC